VISPVVSGQALAYQLRRDLNLTERTFDLVGLIRQLEIEVRFEEIVGNGREGLSLARTGQEIIVVDPSERSAAGRRFTLAHELGHHLLGHTDARDARWEIRQGVPGTKEETEANAFAAELLMPTRLFRSDARGRATTFEALGDLAGMYEVSLTAGAIRFVQVTKGSCALVGCHIRPRRHWQVKSETAKGLWLELPPGRGTLVAGHVDGRETASKGTVPASAWVSTAEGPSDHMVKEEVRKTSDASWLALLSDLPDVEDDTGWEDRAADEERAARRSRFSRY
jgi:IrrE N-terminal-like domain